MMNYNFTDEDIKLVEKFIELKEKGYYCDSNQLTQVYNRVLNKHVNNTSCSSCMRQRIQELADALNHYKSKINVEAIQSPKDSVPEVEPNNTPQKENKAVRKKK